MNKTQAVSTPRSFSTSTKLLHLVRYHQQSRGPEMVQKLWFIGGHPARVGPYPPPWRPHEQKQKLIVCTHWSREQNISIYVPCSHPNSPRKKHTHTLQRENCWWKTISLKFNCPPSLTSAHTVALMAINAVDWILNDIFFLFGSQRTPWMRFYSSN